MRERASGGGAVIFLAGKAREELRNSTLHQSSHGLATRVHGFATKTKALAHEIPPATQANLVHEVCLLLVTQDTLKARFFLKKIKDWILNPKESKTVFAFLYKQIYPKSLWSWCIKGTIWRILVQSWILRFVLTHHDLRDPLNKETQIRFWILSDLRIHFHFLLRHAWQA